MRLTMTFVTLDPTEASAEPRSGGGDSALGAAIGACLDQQYTPILGLSQPGPTRSLNVSTTADAMNGASTSVFKSVLKYDSSLGAQQRLHASQLGPHSIGSHCSGRGVLICAIVCLLRPSAMNVVRPDTGSPMTLRFGGTAVCRQKLRQAAMPASLELQRTARCTPLEAATAPAVVSVDPCFMHVEMDAPARPDSLHEDDRRLTGRGSMSA